MAYTPYKMKADNNDPMTKNFGGVAPGKMRAFGTKTLEGPKKTDTNPGSGLNYTSGVGSSPAKGWLKNLGKKIGGGAKKLMGKTLVGKAFGIGKDKDGGGGGKIKAMDDRISALEEGTGGGGQPGTAMEAMSADKDTSKTVPPPTGGGGSKIDMIKKAQGDAAGGAEAGVGATPLEGGMPYKKKK